MLKKIVVLLLCAACLLAMAAAVAAEGEQTESDAILSEEPLPSEDSELSDDSAEIVSLQLLIGAAFSDNELIITVTDELGEPVPDVPLGFDVGSTVNMTTAFTDAAGTAAISIAGLEPATAIVCRASGFSAENAIYLPASCAVSVPGEAPTTTVATEPTTVPTTEPTTAAPSPVTTMAPLPTLPPAETSDTTRTAPSYAEVRGTTTTNVRGSDVYTNLLIDEHLLGQFGHAIGRFDQVGRLIMDKAAYTSLTQTYGSHLFGKLTTSALSEVTVDQIRTAQKGVSAFADCKPENAEALTFAVSLQFLEDNGSGLPVTDASSLGSDLMFEFSLPVPKSMENCKSFGIAMTGENVLNPLTPVAADGGVISFRTPALGHFTLVGFTDGAPIGGSSLGTLMWLLIGLGVLFLGLTAFLIYRFFFHDRGDDPDDPESGDGGSGDDDNDDGNGSDAIDWTPINHATESSETPADADGANDAANTDDADDADGANGAAITAADGTPLDVEALRQSWVEEDKQVQDILRDVRRNAVRREQDEAMR
ncbi:MAG: Ig-like domain-containing protein [Clostridia bacterium]|nr:Ig-like domain-containing protein [Clostridia bacterium]